MDARYYAYQLQSARRTYDRSNDHKAYMADCLYVAVSVAAAALADRDRRLAHLPKAVSTASYAIKGLVDMIADNLSCPIDQDHTHEDFLQSWYNHGRRFVDRDTQVVKDVLAHLGIWKEASRRDR